MLPHLAHGLLKIRIMTYLQKEQALEKLVKLRIERIEANVDDLDEIFNDELNNSEYASETHKQAMRKSNAITRLKQAIEILKYEC